MTIDSVEYETDDLKVLFSRKNFSPQEAIFKTESAGEFHLGKAAEMFVLYKSLRDHPLFG